MGVGFGDMMGLLVAWRYSGPESTPEERVYTVPAEDRSYTVPAEDRTYTVPAEDRTYTVPAE